MKIDRRPDAVPTASTASSTAEARPTTSASGKHAAHAGHSGISTFVHDAKKPPKPQPKPGSANDLVYQGGKVLSNPVFQPIYVGDYWNTTKGAADRKYNDGFAAHQGTSSHEAVLSQYGVGKGSSAPSVVTPGAPTRVTKADVISLVKQQLASGAVQGSDQTVHMVVLPPGTVLDAGNGVDSTKGLGGFHGSYADANGKNVYFAVVAYSQGSNGIDFTGNGRDNVTITESHEFDEAATDPDVGNGTLGWYNKKYGEIGDLAVNSGLVPFNKTFVRDAQGYDEQVEWSNKDKAFIG